MRNKFLLIAIMAIAFIGIFGCLDPEQTATLTQTPQPTPEYQFKRNDLITIIPYGEGNQYYAFFFKKGKTKSAYVLNIQVRFDGNADEPIVKSKWASDTDNFFSEVEITFRDKDQMREYWPAMGNYSVAR